MSFVPAIAVALDFETPDEALAGARRLAGEVDYLKIGPSLVLKGGPSFLSDLAALGAKLFIDLKFHDIPSTVARAIRSLAPLPVSLLTVHTLGGKEMLEAAVEAAAAARFPSPPGILGVTLLTNLDEVQTTVLGFSRRPIDQIIHLASMAKSAGCRGVVCSPWEAAEVKKTVGQNMMVVTPGIRPEGTSAGDQARLATPKKAAEAGSDCLVIGRPIIEAADPVRAVRAIRASLSP